MMAYSIFCEKSGLCASLLTGWVRLQVTGKGW